MNDEDFLRAFESCELPNESFHHRDHIRLAWIYFHRYGEAEAGRRIAESIRRYAAHHGNSEKYHHTMTLAWMRLVACAARQADGGFEPFARANPALFEKSVLSAYYSDAILNSDQARREFVGPDLKAL